MLRHKSALAFAAMGLVVCASCRPAAAQLQPVNQKPGTQQQLVAQGPTQPAGIPQVRQFLQQSNINDVRSHQVLGIPTSHCGHVIDLMMKNQMRSRLRTNGTEQLHLPHLTVGLQPGDLELLCIHLVCDGDAHQGPIFQIGMKNNSRVPIGNFRVSLVGVLCQIHPHSPSATVCIPRMEAGEETQIQIQLPVNCMSMGPLHQQAEFDTVIVALDSHDELLECDELNNVQILKRTEVSLLGTQQIQVQPVPQTQVAPAPVPTPPAPEEAPSPLDGIDLDKLDLGQGGEESEAQSLLLRR